MQCSRTYVSEALFSSRLQSYLSDIRMGDSGTINTYSVGVCHWVGWSTFITRVKKTYFVFINSSDKPNVAVVRLIS